MFLGNYPSKVAVFLSGSALSPPKGGVWGKYKPKSDVEWAMERAARLPVLPTVAPKGFLTAPSAQGPGEYVVRRDAREVRGGVWGSQNPKSDLEWTILRAAQLPVSALRGRSLLVYARIF